MATGYFLENGKIVEKELKIGKEYHVIEFFDERNGIMEVSDIENIEDIINKHVLNIRAKFLGELKFLGEVENKNGDKLYKIDDEEVNKDYVLFEMI